MSFTSKAVSQLEAPFFCDRFMARSTDEGRGVSQRKGGVDGYSCGLWPWQ